MGPNVRYYLGNYLDIWKKVTAPEWPVSGPSNILLPYSQVKKGFRNYETGDPARGEQMNDNIDRAKK